MIEIQLDICFHGFCSTSVSHYDENIVSDPHCNYNFQLGCKDFTRLSRLMMIINNTVLILIKENVSNLFPGVLWWLGVCSSQFLGLRM